MHHTGYRRLLGFMGTIHSIISHECKCLAVVSSQLLSSLLHPSYCTATGLLQNCHSTATALLQHRCSSAVAVLQHCYNTAETLQQHRYSTATALLQHFYSIRFMLVFSNRPFNKGLNNSE